MKPARSLETWDEKVAPRLSQVRQRCFWIREEVSEILHAIKMMEELLPEWPTEAAHQIKGTVRELRAAADRLEKGGEIMEAKEVNDEHPRKLARQRT